MRRFFVLIMSAFLLLSVDYVSAIAEQNEFILPTDLKIIKRAAFVGTDAAYVLIPEGVTEIHEFAFVDSAVKKIDLPASLEYISKYAFTGLTDFIVVVPENSYAEEFCIKNEIKHELRRDISSDDEEPDYDTEEPGSDVEIPANYPAVVPGIDFDGAHIYIYDYWTASADRVAQPTKKQQATYDYRDWLEATYNCKITQIKKGDWESNITELINFTIAPDGTLCLFILPPDFIGTPMANDLFAAWNENSLINLSSGKWNHTTIDFMTKGGKVYGVSTGYSEPCQCLFFNKRVLEEAGIDWNTIYDMQASGTWTWSAFESMLKKITKDVDDDGIIDIYGLTGNSSDLYMMGVFSNGAEFFKFNKSGKLEIAVNSDAALEGLQWTKGIWIEYAYQQPPNGNWDYYKKAWNQGFCGFYMSRTYAGFDNNSEMSGMDDKWGCVAFPVGPKGDTYLNIVSDNVTVIPNVYDAETVSKLTFIYDMWTNPTPGYDNKFDWIGNKYMLTDRRAVDETYAMLRKPEHCIVNKCLHIGSINDVLGAPLLWQLIYNDPTDLVEAATPAWQALCDAFNGK